MKAPEERIRAPVAAGLFYPDTRAGIMAAFTAFGLDRSLLRTNSRLLLSENTPLENRGIRALVVPHSAWNISGRAVVDAFHTCTSGVSRTVILAAIHDPPRTGFFLSNSGYFDTPLGAVPVDIKAGEELASCSTCFEINDIPHLTEISIEVLLPFIKYCFPRTSIVPILMGRSSPPLIKALAGALNVVFGGGNGGKTLFIIPSCLAKNSVHEKAAAQAECFVRLLLEGDGQAVTGGIGTGIISGCGAAPAAAFLESGLAENRERRILSSGIDHITVSERYVYYGSINLA